MEPDPISISSIPPGHNDACEHCNKGSGVFVCSQFEPRRRATSEVRGHARTTRLYSISSIFEEDRWVVQAQVENRKRERYKQMCRMLALMLVPVVALLAVTAILLTSVITKQNSTDAARIHVQCFLSVNSLVDLLYNETDATLAVMLSRGTDAESGYHMMRQRNTTNDYLLKDFLIVCENKKATHVNYNPGNIINDIKQIRSDVDRNILNGSIMADRFDKVVGHLLNRSQSLQKFPDDHAGILNELFSINALCHAAAALRQQQDVAHLVMHSCKLSNAVSNNLARQDGVIDAYLGEGGAPQLSMDIANSQNNTPINDLLNKAISNATFCENGSHVAKLQYVHNLFDSKLRHISKFTKTLSQQLQTDLDNLRGHTRNKIIIYSIIAALISVVCIWASLWYASCIQTLTHVLSLYALKSAEKSKELAQEKKKTESLLYQMMPPTIANQLRDNREVKAQYYDMVTICFSDIVGFTSLSSISTPFQIVNLLNDLYSMFDSAIDQFDVYKVETIGDAYMVVSGLPEKNENHTTEIADMSLEIRRAVQDFTIPHLPDKKLYIRIGFHTGPCMAGVVGTKMPRYCLFGDAVNVASRMESTSEAQKIQISQETRDILIKTKTFVLEKRGDVDVKGKGVMTTYWLVKKERINSKRKTSFRIPNAERNEQEPLMNCNGHYNKVNTMEQDGYKQGNMLSPGSYTQQTILLDPDMNRPCNALDPGLLTVVDTLM